MIKEIISLIRSILSIVGVIVGMGVLVGIVAVYALYWAYPEVWFLGSLVLRLPDLRWLIFIGTGILVGVGIVNGWYKSGVLAYWKTRILIAWMLAYFAKYSFSAVGNNGWWGAMGVGVAMFWISGVLMEMGKRFSLKKELANIKSKKKYFGYAMVASLIMLGVVSLTGIVVEKRAKRIAEKKAWLADHPVMEVLEPKIVFSSNKILIKGKHFGWQEDKQSKAKLMSSEGEVRVDLWTNEKIIFTVPLGWAGKTVNVWIEKEREWKGKKIRDKSDVLAIKVLSLDNLSKEDEKLYYQELRSISDEAKGLNGY